MPKAKVHWTHDLLAVALVGGISGLVFWLLPPDVPAQSTAALGEIEVAFSTSLEYPACNVVIS